MKNLRLTAALIINEVTDGASLSACLDHQLIKIKDSRDRAFVQAVCYGVCRFYPRLDVILSHLLQTPMKAKDSDVHALLMVGLYQLMEMRVPHHAAVAETVNATEGLEKPWARGLTNAILREYLRSQEKIQAEVEADPEAKFAHPEWWLKAVQAAWPNDWMAILDANNAHPPFALRVNRTLTTRDAYLQRLESAELIATAMPETETGIVLSTPVNVEVLPGFAAGEISVQDGAAQLAAPLLNLTSGLTVLDACAAPGGKLAHLLEIEPKLKKVIAVEMDAERIPSINENLKRMQLGRDVKVAVHCNDASDTDAWWDGDWFDRILLDAPCSASGVVRRHPDIKLLRQPGDIKALAKQQLELLRALWTVLKPGGLLLYVTCSIFPAENQEVITEFLASHADAKEEKIAADWGIACEVGRQILPGVQQMDGFYYARLKKT